jgi:hypothetical protein
MRLKHFACWYRVDLLLGSRLPVAARAGSADLLAGCCVDLPVRAALHTNRKNDLFRRSKQINPPG